MFTTSALGTRILAGLGKEAFGNCSCGLACPVLRCIKELCQNMAQKVMRLIGRERLLTFLRQSVSRCLKTSRLSKSTRNW